MGERKDVHISLKSLDPGVSRSGREDEKRLVSSLIDDEFPILVALKYLCTD